FPLHRRTELVDSRNQRRDDEALAQRILPGEKPPRKVFIDHGDTRAALRIFVIKRAAPHHLDSKRFEIAGSDHLKRRVGLVAALSWRLACDIEIPSEVSAFNRHSGRKR